METKRRPCFIDNIFPIVNYDVEGNILAKGYLLRIQSETAIYYTSSYFYLSLGDYDELKERLGDRMITQGHWLHVSKLRGKGYGYQNNIDCIAFPQSWDNIEPAFEIQDRKDDEIRQFEKDFRNLKETHPECPFPLDGRESLDISVLKVGQGDLILVKFPSRRGLIIDAHYLRSHRNKIHSYITQFFEGQSPEAILISHKHLDHIRYVEEIITNQKIKECWVGVCSTHPHSNPSLKKIYSGLNAQKIKILAINNSVTYNDNNLKMEILYPAGSNCIYDRDQNKHSIVLDITWCNNRIILGGDLHNDGWTNLYSHNSPRQIKFFKTPHHCSNTGLSPSMIQNFNIEYAVTSCGANKQYKHPHCEPLKTYLLATQHQMTRLVNSISINYTINRSGYSNINPNRSIFAARDCQYLECYQNCCFKCLKQNINNRVSLLPPNRMKSII
jgi:competence protein ComEC